MKNGLFFRDVCVIFVISFIEEYFGLKEYKFLRSWAGGVVFDGFRE